MGVMVSVVVCLTGLGGAGADAGSSTGYSWGAVDTGDTGYSVK